ncbi:MAG: helix-turn-helix transcriptional regulator [Vicinamibacterales bacterium]
MAERPVSPSKRPNEWARVSVDPGSKGGTRTRLLELSVALVEHLRCAQHERSPEDYCHVYQVCLPYRGLGIWHVGGEEVIADATQAIFVRGGEAYQMSGPVAGGYAELVLTPNVELLTELLPTNGNRLFGHPVFKARSGRASSFLQNFRTRFLYWATALPNREPMNADELVIALLRAAFQGHPRRGNTCSNTTARLIRQAKEYLEAELPNRVTLADVARVVGASPAYLTDVFSRVEGTSLHQYLTKLRLARALAELPHAGNLTALAFDVGFSSHSHFSAVFRRAFGLTPSQFRETTRRRLRPVIDGCSRT